MNNLEKSIQKNSGLITSFVDSPERVQTCGVLGQCSKFTNLILASQECILERIPQKAFVSITFLLDKKSLKNLSTTSLKINRFVAAHTYFDIPFHLEKLNPTNGFFKIVLMQSEDNASTIKKGRAPLFNINPDEDLSEEVFQLLKKKDITFLDINELCNWESSIDDAKDRDWIVCGSDEFMFQLGVQALALKKEYSTKYPTKTVSFNPECTAHHTLNQILIKEFGMKKTVSFNHTLNQNLNWLLIDGVNAETFEKNLSKSTA